MARRWSLACAVAALLAAAPPAIAAPSPAAAVPARVSLAQLRAQYQRPGDHYLDLDGVSIRYRDEGHGPALVLLHGSRSTLDSWDGVVARLKSHYRIIRFDQPPTGLSGPVSDAALKAIGSPEAVVAGVMDTLHVDHASIAGTSSGGTLAYYFAATYPQRVDTLILSNTPADDVGTLKPASTPALDAAIARFKATGIEGRDFWQAYLYDLYGDPARITPQLVNYYYGIGLRTIEPNRYKLHALTSNVAVTADHLHRVTAPVLILWGMRDPVLLPAAEHRLASRLDQAKSISTIELSDVGHYPPLEVPARYAALIDAYLGNAKP